MNGLAQPRTRFVWQRPIKRPTYEPSGATLTNVGNVVHTRGFGSPIVSIGASLVFPVAVVHTRAIGTPQLNQRIDFAANQTTTYQQGSTVDQSVTTAADWSPTDPNRLWTDDGQGVSVTMNPGQFSEDLRSKDLKFAIPLGATIKGIEMVINISAVPGGSYDFYPGLTINGTSVNGQKYDSSPGTGLHIYGSPTDDWGASRTPAQINASTFGALIEAQKIGGVAGTLTIDRISIRIYYTLPGVVHTRAFGVPSLAIKLTTVAVVHTRAFGTSVVSRGSVTLSPSAVVHTRAFGVPNAQVPTHVFTVSVIHQRGFGIPALGPPIKNPPVIQLRIAMQEEWMVKQFEKNQRDTT